MSKIVIVTAADNKFKDLAEMCIKSAENVGYQVITYDLGNLGFGIPFIARISDNIGAKIPSKPEIIKDALTHIDQNDIVVWADADTIIWDTIDEILKIKFDIGVTVRNPKEKENDLPINAGVVFVKKTKKSLEFIDEWINLCSVGSSDQQELNKLCLVSTKDLNSIVTNKNDVSIYVFPCDIYNNFYFKKSQLHAKITHYKTKHRHWWPNRTVKKIPKGYSKEQIKNLTVKRFR